MNAKKCRALRRQIREQKPEGILDKTYHCESIDFIRETLVANANGVLETRPEPYEKKCIVLGNCLRRAFQDAKKKMLKAKG